MNPSMKPDDNERLTSASNEIDFVDILLTPTIRDEVSAVQQQIFGQAQRLLRRKRLLRRCGWVCSLAVCYLAGILTMFVFSSASQQGQEPVLETNALPESQTPNTERVPSLPSARDREWHALESTTEQAKEYREAGDAYLTEQMDPSAALRCYTAALDKGGSDSLEVTSSDSWLMMQIKNARLKEKNDAKNVR